jgi:hypothetical protein
MSVYFGDPVQDAIFRGDLVPREQSGNSTARNAKNVVEMYEQVCNFEARLREEQRQAEAFGRKLAIDTGCTLSICQAGIEVNP